MIKDKNIDPSANIATTKIASTLTGKTLTTATLTAPTITAPVISGAATIATGATITTPTILLTTQVLAAAGSIQGDAGAIGTVTPSLVHATGADATKGVRLPLAVAGMQITIKNADAANAILKVWPGVGDAINAIAGDTNISMAAKTSAVFTAIDATTWFTTPLLPS